MRAIRSAALSRQAAPGFLLIGPDELRRLRLVGHLARSLFLELVAMADHRSGVIERTSYAVLLALLDFDQAPGAHAAEKPTLKRVRTALEHLESVRLVLVDRRANERDRGLSLSLAPRSGITAPDAGKGSRSGRPETAEKPAKARLPRVRRGKEGQRDGQGVQEKENLTPTPLTASYPQTRTDQAQGIGEVLRGALQMAPPVGPDVAPSGRTPPAPSRWVQQAREANARRKIKAPPGGQDEERPPEGAPELQRAA